MGGTTSSNADGGAFGKKDEPKTVVDSYIEKLPGGDTYIGFENPTAALCYCNSAMQMLFHCQPFRNRVMSYKHTKNKADGDDVNMLLEVQKLFKDMVKKASTKNKGYDHKNFIKAVKKGNVLFDNDQH